MRQVAPVELKTWLADEPGSVDILDVREPWETALCTLEGSVAIPLGDLPGRLQELDPARPTVVLCHHGVRSLSACAFLARAGFARVMNLQGGIDAWARSVDPSMPVY